MNKRNLGLTLIFTFWVTALCLAQAVPVGSRWAFVVNTTSGKAFLKTHADQVESFTVFGDKTVFLGRDALLGLFKEGNVTYESWPLRPEESPWMMTTKDPALRRAVFPGARIILQTQGYRVLLANETARMGLGSKLSDFTRLDPLPVNTVVLTPPAMPLKRQPQDSLSTLLERLDMEAFLADVKALVALQTRYTYSDGAVQAIGYCEKQLLDLGLKPRRLPFGGTSTPRENLEAIQKGFDSGNSGEVVIIGHLDSTSPQASKLAPGADDNGSGAAGVLAMARFMKGLNPRASVRYVLVLGEEQGMVGSKAYVAALQPADLAKIRAVINMDMIAFDKTEPLSIMIETGTYNQKMAESMTGLAAKYTKATTQISYNPWGSDHMPFIKKEIPTVLTIESEFDDNPTYHQITDLPENMNLDLCREILRLNAASLAVFSSVDRLPHNTRQD